MIQKNNRFAQSTRRVHHATPLPNRWLPMDSELYSVVTHSFTRLPCTFTRKDLEIDDVAVNLRIAPAPMASIDTAQ